MKEIMVSLCCNFSLCAVQPTLIDMNGMEQIQERLTTNDIL